MISPATEQVHSQNSESTQVATKAKRSWRVHLSQEWLQQRKRLTPREERVFLAIEESARTHCWSFEGNEKIASKASMHVSKVKEVIRSLEAKGFVVRVSSDRSRNERFGLLMIERSTPEAPTARTPKEQREAAATLRGYWLKRKENRKAKPPGAVAKGEVILGADESVSEGTHQLVRGPVRVPTRGSKSDPTRGPVRVPELESVPDSYKEEENTHKKKEVCVLSSTSEEESKTPEAKAPHPRQAGADAVKAHVHRMAMRETGAEAVAKAISEEAGQRYLLGHSKDWVQQKAYEAVLQYGDMPNAPARVTGLFKSIIGEPPPPTKYFNAKTDLPQGNFVPCPEELRRRPATPPSHNVIQRPAPPPPPPVASEADVKEAAELTAYYHALERIKAVKDSCSPKDPVRHVCVVRMRMAHKGEGYGDLVIDPRFVSTLNDEQRKAARMLTFGWQEMFFHPACQAGYEMDLIGHPWDKAARVAKTHLDEYFKRFGTKTT